jgi:hypothetical protein
MYISKAVPSTSGEGPEGEYRYSAILSLTSARDGGELLTPRPSNPRERNPVPIV